jgi:hypothetical protein
MLAVHSDQYWSGHSAGSIDSLPKLEAAKAFLKVAKVSCVHC